MIKHLISLFIVLSSATLFSQYNTDSVSVVAFQLPVEVTVIDEAEIDSLGNPLEAVNLDLYTYQVAISLPDTLNITSLGVTLTDAGQAFETATFTFDGTPPTGHDYLRDGSSVILTLDQYAYRDAFTCELVINDLAGVPSSPVTYDFETILLDDE